jgi:hypothetical protein
VQRSSPEQRRPTLIQPLFSDDEAAMVPGRQSLSSRTCIAHPCSGQSKYWKSFLRLQPAPLVKPKSGSYLDCWEVFPWGICELAKWTCQPARSLHLLRFKLVRNRTKGGALLARAPPPRWMATVMAQDTTARAQEQAMMEAVKPARPFSAEGVIGGKLRTLYEGDAQPSPSRIDELLGALDRD